jgi:hypothetical protein
VQDIELFYRVGNTVANAAKTPEWKPGAEFKAARDKSLSTGQ